MFSLDFSVLLDKRAVAVTIQSSSASASLGISNLFTIQASFIFCLLNFKTLIPTAPHDFASINTPDSSNFNG
ncbi:hypothetical protein L1987_81917 [Smallanthus sonchifolius]|uniref:Uncharacterized protein n=1 Tax=Smallanthus sonchifolius TaxID=185202 RepID=A0ACB8YR44_9ASTR|nr:hypothetical protein L1987_88349 [Smallanthus sonchifolius]KAI3668641.1 hypothetical protein L1987_88354 [Smallanthus sonchifolius]KAI3688207.1 hypothetical protein L1987_81917 [Smallanthus sonchifolius]